MLKKIVSIVAGVALSLGLMAGSAYAALPASVGTTISSIQTDGQSVFDLVFPVIAGFVGLVVIIKLFKRFSGKL